MQKSIPQRAKEMAQIFKNPNTTQDVIEEILRTNLEIARIEGRSEAFAESLEMVQLSSKFDTCTEYGYLDKEGGDKIEVEVL